MHIPIARPNFHEDDLNRLKDTLDRGWVGMGPYVQEFERLFATFVKVEKAVSCSSGTAALHLALAAANIGPKDEVIVPSFTWVSSVNAILFQGATPVLCDIKLDDFNVCPDALEACITPQTKAIIVVHLFGAAADMERLMAIAEKHQLTVIEDAACALGTRIGDRHAGCIGNFGTFSFHPRKVITTGEGGMVISTSNAGQTTLTALRNHGITADGHVADLGYNYRLSDLQAAVGVGQMALLDSFLQARRTLADRYTKLLESVEGIRSPVVSAGTTHSFQAYVCLLDNAANDARDRLIERLAERGVQTRMGTHAVHCLNWHSKHLVHQPAALARAAFAHHHTIALPLFPGLTEKEQRFIVEQLADALKIL